MNIALVSQKRVYVPAAHKKAPSSPTPRIPKELALTSVADAFRTVAWDGAASAEVAPENGAVAPIEATAQSRFGGINPQTSARAAFSQIPWNGERPSDEQTGEQSKESVKAVLDAFRWE